MSRSLFASHGRFRCDRSVPPRWWLSTSPGGQRSAPVAAGATAPPSSSLGLYQWQVDALDAVGSPGRPRGGRGCHRCRQDEGRGQPRPSTSSGGGARCSWWYPRWSCSTSGSAELGDLIWAGAPADRSDGRRRRATHLASHDVVVAVVNSARAFDLPPHPPGRAARRSTSATATGSAVEPPGPRPLGSTRRPASAPPTPERTTEPGSGWDPYFGGTCFRLGYARAVGDGSDRPLSVTLVGAALSPIVRSAARRAPPS